MMFDPNLLPKELRPRPPITLVTAILLVVVILLGAGTYLMYNGKSDANDKNDKLKAQQATLEAQTTAVLQNPEIARLQGLITQTQAQVNAQVPVKQDYESFVASWVNWDKVLAQLQSVAESTNVTLESVANLESVAKKTGNAVDLKGTAPTNKAVFDYVLALQARQQYFSSVGFPTVQSQVSATGTTVSFTLSVEVKSGGASQ